MSSQAYFFKPFARGFEPGSAIVNSLKITCTRNIISQIQLTGVTYLPVVELFIISSFETSVGVIFLFSAETARYRTIDSGNSSAVSLSLSLLIALRKAKQMSREVKIKK